MSIRRVLISHARSDHYFKTYRVPTWKRTVKEMCHEIAFQSNCSFRCLVCNILIRTAYQYFAEKEDLILPFSCDICAYVKVPCETPIDKYTQY